MNTASSFADVISMIRRSKRNTIKAGADLNRIHEFADQPVPGRRRLHLLGRE